MPTVGKVVAALTFGAVAVYVSLLIQDMYAEERPFDNLAWINACLAAIVAWRVAGRRAGTGYNAAFGYWLTTTIAVIFVCLFFNSFADMIRQSMRMQYDGPMEGIVDIASIMWDYGQEIATQDNLLTAFGGGLIAAMITEFFGRRFP